MNPNDTKTKNKKGARQASKTSPAKKKEVSRKKERQFTQIIFRDWCKACGICSAFCPKAVIERDDEGLPRFRRPEDCTGCRSCELRCPDFAITIKEKVPQSEENAF
jgi:2-oxoglutarate ferredoxin oxidoreductase subunit delta